jgi:hypothetical protein
MVGRQNKRDMPDVSGASRRLSNRDLRELADALAFQLHSLLGDRVFRLQRGDVAELIEPYIDDLESREDRKALTWLIWHLFQDAHDIMLHEQQTIRLGKHRRR